MRLGRIVGFLGAILGAALACAPAKKAALEPPHPPPVDWGARISEADALMAKGPYLAMKAALQIYEEALAVPDKRQAASEKYVRASLALGLREKELGILASKPDKELAAFIAASPALASYAPWRELVSGLLYKIKGNPGLEQVAGLTLEGHFDWVNTRIAALDAELAGRAESDDLAACLRLAARAAYYFKFSEKLEPKLYLDRHPDSRLLAFQTAVSPSPDDEKLETLLAAEPDFAEIHYYVGDLALLAGKILTAEKHYLAAYQKIPESLSLLISLAKVAFQMEELEPCLEYNEKALARLPAYRDALLGKGLCLGYLGRNEDALGVLGRLLELGTYYIGEAHYWSAWNLNELARLDEARKEIDAAKVFLVGVNDVLTLSGIIAYKQGRLDDAEKDLRASLDVQPGDSDAAFYLGRLYADRKDWLNSGIYFSGAAASLEEKEKSLEKKIEEIEASDLTPERKAKMVVKKRVQILSTQATKATSQYNGAAGFHNAGQFDRALALARLAAAHPAFAEKAAELIKLIRER